MAIDGENIAHRLIFYRELQVGNADNADRSMDRLPKANLPAFNDKGIRVVLHQGWYGSSKKTIVPEPLGAVKF
jgi:hypothetical protein